MGNEPITSMDADEDAIIACYEALSRADMLMAAQTREPELLLTVAFVVIIVWLSKRNGPRRPRRAGRGMKTMANESRALTQVGEWRAYVKKNPQPDGLWWPLKWEKSLGDFSDIARTHPTAFGVWREKDGTYTVAIKAEAKRERLAGWKMTSQQPDMSGRTGAREVKRRNIPDLLTLRTYLITLAKDPNTP